MSAGWAVRCHVVPARVRGAREVNSDISVTGLDAVLSDLNRKEIGLELILKMPMLTNEQRNEVLSSVDG
jgi:hypothetical protein